MSSLVLIEGLLDYIPSLMQSDEMGSGRVEVLSDVVDFGALD